MHGVRRVITLGMSYNQVCTRVLTTAGKFYVFIYYICLTHYYFFHNHNPTPSFRSVLLVIILHLWNTIFKQHWRMCGRFFAKYEKNRDFGMKLYLHSYTKNYMNEILCINIKFCLLCPLMLFKAFLDTPRYICDDCILNVQCYNNVLIIKNRRISCTKRSILVITVVLIKTYLLFDAEHFEMKKMTMKV